MHMNVALPDVVPSCGGLCEEWMVFESRIPEKLTPLQKEHRQSLDSTCNKSITIKNPRVSSDIWGQ